jgi:hypothetical protein
MAIENISQDVADLLATKDYDVKYTDGQGQDSSPEEAKTFVTPEGWHIATFQNGDVASTKYLLLERTIDSSKKNDSVFGFVESSKELLSDVALLWKEDKATFKLEEE